MKMRRRRREVELIKPRILRVNQRCHTRGHKHVNARTHIHTLYLIHTAACMHTHQTCTHFMFTKHSAHLTCTRAITRPVCSMQDNARRRTNSPPCVHMSSEAEHRRTRDSVWVQTVTVIQLRVFPRNWQQNPGPESLQG